MATTMTSEISARAMRNMRLRRSVVVMDEPPSKAIGTPLRSQAHPGGDWLVRTG